MKPLVSILIAAYNVDSYIEKCIESCISQSYDDIEVVVINDGSTDNTSTLIDSLVNKDKRIRHVYKPNGGLVSARKAGVEHAKGAYIFFLDGDDTIPGNAVYDLVNPLSSDDYDIVLGGMRTLNYQGQVVKDNYTPYKQGGGGGFINQMLISSNAHLVGHLYKRELFDGFSYPTDLYKSLGEDLVTNTMLGLKVNKIVAIPEITYNYMTRADSLTGVARSINSWVLGYGAFVEVSRLIVESGRLQEVLQGFTKLFLLYYYNYLSVDVSFTHRKHLLVTIDLLLKNNQYLSTKDWVMLNLGRLNLPLARCCFKMQRTIKSWFS